MGVRASPRVGAARALSNGGRVRELSVRSRSLSEAGETPPLNLPPTGMQIGRHRAGLGVRSRPVSWARVFAPDPSHFQLSAELRILRRQVFASGLCVY